MEPSPIGAYKSLQNKFLNFTKRTELYIHFLLITNIAIGKTNSVYHEFHLAYPGTTNLRMPKCTSFYGRGLWDLYCEQFNSMLEYLRSESTRSPK